MFRARVTKFVAVWLSAMLVVCAGGFPGSLPIPEAHASGAVLTIDAGTAAAPMKPEIRGTNIGLWKSNEFHPVSNRTDRFVNLLKEAGITMVRFPAGAESDNVYFDRSNTGAWYEGPGPYTRTMRAETLDSFIDLVREIGAEPLITVNAKINNSEMAADMVRYANIENDYNIKYWEIGNEPEFFTGDYKVTALEYAERIAEYRDAMKAVDPSIIIVGPANSQPLPFLSSWTQPILSYLDGQNKQVDAISIHWYPLDGYQSNPGSAAYPSIENLLKYEGTDWQNAYISWANRFTNTTPGNNLVHYRDLYAPGALIGITELGQVTAHGQGIADTLAGALWLGDVLGRLAYHQVDFVTQFLFQGNQTYALIDDSREVRPAYYVYPLLKRYFGDTLVTTATSDNQNFTIWASTRTGVYDKLYLMVINKHATDDLSATINLTDFDPQATASTWVLNAPAIGSLTGASINGVQVAADGTLPEIAGHTISGVSDSFTRTFPAHSITMIELTAKADSAPPVRHLGQYALGANERKGPSDWPGNPSVTPHGWGKKWQYAGAMSWSVHFPETREYDFSLRAYGEGSDPSLKVRINGQDVPDTSWSLTNSWIDYEGSLGVVQAGVHTVEVFNTSAIQGSNINVAHMAVFGAAPGPFTLTSPANQTVTDATSVTLDWTQSIGGRTYAPFGAVDYNIVVADNPGLLNPAVNTTVTSTTHAIHNLAYGATYYWQVVANNANGATPATAVFSFTTPPEPVAAARYLGQYAMDVNERKTASEAPGSTLLTPQGWGQVWQQNAARWAVHFPVTGEYDVAVRAYGDGTDPSFKVRIGGQDVADAAWSASGAWTDYEGRTETVTAGIHLVEVYNDSPAPGDRIHVAHLDVFGAAPGSFSLKSPEHEAELEWPTVTLDWTQVADGRQFAPFGAAQYTVVVADNPGLLNPVVDRTVAATTLPVNDLQFESEYYWQVIAHNNNGSTPADAVFRFTTPEAPDHTEAARYLGQYATNMNERRTPSDTPGNAIDTPDGFGKVWQSGTGRWAVHFPRTGVYDFSIRVYGEGTSRFRIRLNGVNVPDAAWDAPNAWIDYEGSFGLVPAGTHLVELNNNSAAAHNNIAVAHIDIFGAAPGPFALMSPADQATLDSTTITLDWTQAVANRNFAPQGADDYTVIVADNPGLLNPLVYAVASSTTHQVQLPGNGDYYWQVIAHNANGSTPANDVSGFTVEGAAADLALPVTTALIQGDRHGDWYRSDVTVMLNAADEGSGVARTEYRFLDNEDWTIYDSAITLEAEGIHTLEYRSVDLADNMEETRVLVIALDKTAPSWSIANQGVELQNGVVLSDTQLHTFVLEVSDALSGVSGASLLLNGAAYESGQAVSLAGQAGAHQLEIAVEDHAGNRAEAVITFLVEAAASLDSLELLLQQLIDSGELAGPLSPQLRNALNQAKHHLGKGDPDKAAEHLDRFLSHLNNPPMSRHVSVAAKEALELQALALIDQWTVSAAEGE